MILIWNAHTRAPYCLATLDCWQLQYSMDESFFGYLQKHMWSVYTRMLDYDGDGMRISRAVAAGT